LPAPESPGLLSAPEPPAPFEDEFFSAGRWSVT
jgi:hypothetical protein